MTIAFSDEENALLDKIAIDLALDTLPPLERDLIRCRYAYGDPPGGARTWPRSYDAIGRRLGRLHAKRPLGPTSMRDWAAAAHLHLTYTYQSAMSDRFLTVRKQYSPLIHTLATALSQQDPEFANDLRQEGDFALWRVGPEKWSNVPYCNAAIRSAMLNYRKREHRLRGDAPLPSRETRQRVAQRPRKLRRAGRKHRGAL